MPDLQGPTEHANVAWAHKSSATEDTLPKTHFTFFQNLIESSP